MIEPNSEASTSEVFAIADNIIPIREASVDTILNTEFTEEMQAVPESQVKRLIIQNRPSNPMSKFFLRVSSYLDNLESFLANLNWSYQKSIEQKKEILESELNDQTARTQRAKKTAKKHSDNRKKSRPTIGAGDTEALSAIALTLGLGAVRAVESITNLFSGGKVYSDVAKSGEFDVSKTGTNVTDPPAWIPFPKGTTGLTYTSGFGERWGRPHTGIDIAGDVGKPIITPISGVVVRSENQPGGYGNIVTVKSGNLEMDFAHMENLMVKVDQKVKAGTQVGGLGNTGRSSGPHLHWNVYVGGNPVDPVRWTYSNPPFTDTSSFEADGSEEPLDNESEGGINYQRIMVGEAGAEFVIPMSQMPIFAHLMMEEKIKSLMPLYFTPAGRFDDIGFERKSGFSNTMMSEGGIAEGIKWIKEEEGISSLVPGRNKYVKPSWPEYRNVTDNTVFHAYETGVSGDRTTIGWGFTFLDEITSGRKPVTPGMTMTKKEADDLLEYQVRHYHDNFLDTKYYPRFKYFTPKQQAGVILYGFNQPYFWNSAPAFSRAIEEGNLREASEQVGRGLPAREKYERMLLRSGPLQIVGPGIVGEGKVGPGKVGSGLPLLPDLTIINGIMNLFQEKESETEKSGTSPMINPQIEKNLRDRSTMSPSEYFGTKSVFSSRLNNIPGNDQMEVANSYGDQFSLDNSKGEIIALYKPTVYYSDPV
jgi:murein DD-endopeptidase MepM/ murein hydrolase activator NlpD/GH24 family phage-related lysozyme (muramidase)